MLKLPKKSVKYFLLVFCLLIFISRCTTALKNPLQKTLRPQLSLISLARREIRGLIFYHRNYLENERLHKQVSFLSSKLVDLSEATRENSRLKNILSFKQRSPLRLIAARVIGRSPDNWSSSILVDKGRYSGIRPGMVVISYAGLVGRVVEASDSMSRILLINDPGLGVSALDQRSRQEGLVNGTLGANLIMRYLPEDADIEVNDKIITSDLSRIYPKGLAIGDVISIGREFSGLNRYAIIKPAASLSAIEEVLIIIP